jgi:nucleotide-binding universal stress UspA family protein
MIEGKKTIVEEIAFHVARGRAAPSWSTGEPANDCDRPRALSDLGMSSPVSGRFVGGRLPLRPRRIIVGIDFSSVSEGARRLALGLARTTGAAVDLVGVLDAFDELFVRRNDQLMGGGGAGMDVDSDAAVDALQADIEEALLCRERLARAAGIRCEHTFLTGVPGFALSDHAIRTGADLIVLGAGPEEPARFGWAWGARAAEQILQSGKWRGPVLLRRRA